MQCPEVRELLSAELDAALPDEDAAAVFHHLATCALCRRWYREVRQTVSFLSSLETEPAPVAVRERVEQANADRPVPVDRPRRGARYQVPRPLAWAAAVLLVLQLGLISAQLAGFKPLTTDRVEEEVPSMIVLTADDRTSATTVIQSAAVHESDTNVRNGG